MVGASVSQAMDQPWIGVESEDDWSVLGEELVEVGVAEAVWVLGLRLQPHQIDDVDDADFQVGEVLAHDEDSRQRLQRGYIAATDHDHVGLGTLVVRGPLPDADACCAVLDGGVHCQPLRRRVLARDDEVHVMATAQTVVHHRKQTVGVRWKVGSHHIRFLVHDQVDEAGILMREAVVVLTPDVRCQQVVQGCDLASPRQIGRDRQPLGVLVEHRVDDMDERLVGVEDAVPPGEQVALEPALALMLAEHRVEHASVRREKLVVRQGCGVPLTIGHLKDGTEAVGHGLVRPKDTKVALLAVKSDHIAQERPQHARVADTVLPGRGYSGCVLAEIRHLQIAEQYAAVGVRIGAHASFALGRKLGQLWLQAATLIEKFVWPIAPEPGIKQLEVSRTGARMQRHLVRPERVFDLHTINDPGPRPALG